MGTSSSRLDQLESLVRSLRSTNAQLERQLLTVSSEADATKRADLICIIQAENEKLMRENERNHLQLADELKKIRAVSPASNEMGASDPIAASKIADAERVGAMIDSLTARLQALLKRGGGGNQGNGEEDASAAASPKAGRSREEELQALIRQLEEQIAGGTASAHAEIARLQAIQAKSEENQRVALAEQERKSAERLEVAAKSAQTEIRRLETEKIRLSERLAHDYRRGPCCLTKDCSAAVTRRIESDVAGGASSPDGGVCAACSNPAAPEEGQPSARLQHAAYFCSNGHASYCDACWEKKVEAACTAVLATVAPLPAVSSESEPSEALMRALPPLRVVPDDATESDPAAVSPASKIHVPATASSSSSSDESKEPEANAAVNYSSFVQRTCPSCHQSYYADAQLHPQAVPCLLQCAHTLCTTCAQRDLAQVGSTGAALIRCCVCTQPTMLSGLGEGGVLPEATAIVELVQQLGSQTSTGAVICHGCEDAAATVQCERCAHLGASLPLCRECFVAAHTLKTNKDHVPIAFTAPANGLCSAHKKPLTQFCSYESCWMPLCDACVKDHTMDRDKHVVVDLETFARQYIRKIEEAGSIGAAALTTVELARTHQAWLDQSRDAQRQAQETQSLTIKQTVEDLEKIRLESKAAQEHTIDRAVELVKMLQAKATAYVHRGIVRRTRLAPTLSQMAALTARIESAVQSGPLSLLRQLPACVRQLEVLQNQSQLEQDDVRILNLQVFSHLLQQVTCKIAETGLDEFTQQGAPSFWKQLGELDASQESTRSSVASASPMAPLLVSPDPESLHKQALALFRAPWHDDLPRDRAAALELWKQAAELGYAEAQFQLAKRFTEGYGPTAKSEQLSATWFLKAAEQGHAEAQLYMGQLYQAGSAVVPSSEQATSWCQRAVGQLQSTAKGGDPDSQLLLGECFANGIGLDNDEAQSIAWCTKAAEQGYAPAQVQMGINLLLSNSGRKRSEAGNVAVEWLRKAAEQGDHKGQMTLAICYEQGRGVQQSLKSAVEWLTKAAANGNPEAQMKLAMMYAAGTGVPQSDDMYVVLVRRAAFLNDAEAQYHLGKAYRDGKGIAHSADVAVEWFSKAAERGHDGAQVALAVCYIHGHGVTRSLFHAREWLAKATAASNEEAYRKLVYLDEEDARNEVTNHSTRGTSKDRLTSLSVPSSSSTVAAADLDALHQRALQLFKGPWHIGLPNDRETAIELWREAAQLGHAESQFRLATCLAARRDDSTKSAMVGWLTKAAEQGHVLAQLSLGEAYSSGQFQGELKGVTEEMVQQYQRRAIDGLRSAAERGDSEAQLRLSDCFQLGDGVLKDQEQAVLWATKAAEQGFAEAQKRLALCFQYGWGVVKTPKVAVWWMQKAADQGDADSLHSAGTYYAKGFGVTQSEVIAVHCYQRAALRAHTPAMHQLAQHYDKTNRPLLATMWRRRAAELGDNRS